MAGPSSGSPGPSEVGLPGLVEDDQGQSGVLRDPVPRRLVGDHADRSGLLDQRPDPVHGVPGVRRCVGAARAQYGEHGHHDLHAAFEDEHDRCLGPHSRGAQAAGQGVGAGVELGVGELLGGADEGGRVGRPRGDLGEPLGNARHGVPRGVAGPLRELVPLVGRQQVEGGQGQPRLRGGGGDEAAQPLAEAPGRRLLEQLGVVLQGDPQGAVALLVLHDQVEQRAGAREQHLGDVEAGQLDPLGKGVLEHHHGLEQRGAAGVALGDQFLDQPVEGEFVVEGVPHGGAHLVEEGRHGVRGARPGADDDGVDEEADQVVGLLVVPARGGDAQGHVAGAGRGRQQQLGHRGERHEESRAPAAAQLLQGLGLGGGQLEAVHRAPGGADLRTRPVGGQGERLHLVQLPLPVGEAVRDGGAVPAVLLPGGEVGVLHLQFGGAVARGSIAAR